jgi:antitoxin (DNA-binding transcriptional repressor) of toxin-antitoxin stability system
MRTATVRELRNEFSRLSKWLESGETVQIIKRGKPFARVVPEPNAKSFFGAGVGAIKLPPDIDDPVGVEWEAMK